MAMEECRECGDQVSTGAETCPHCGVSYPTSEAGQRALTIWLWAAIIGGLVFFWLRGWFG